MNKDSKIFVAGHRGLVGSAIVRMLKDNGYSNILTRTRQELNLLNQQDVSDFFRNERPEYVFDAAARVGGIYANDTFSADFIYENIQIQNNLIHSSWKYGVEKFLFLGSVCIYPKFAEVPVKEESLLTGYLEPTNDAYAIAKIAGIKMCQSYRQQYGFDAISLQPTNLYGVNDNFNPESSHVIPGIMRRMHEAKLNGDSQFVCWGDGSPLREFLYIDDMAEACYICMNEYDDSEIINIGTGSDITIKELTEIIAKVIDYRGEIVWDISKPNGTPRKVMNVDKLKSLGWSPKVGIRQGIYQTYEWFKENYDRI